MAKVTAIAKAKQYSLADAKRRARAEKAMKKKQQGKLPPLKDRLHRRSLKRLLLNL